MVSFSFAGYIAFGSYLLVGLPKSNHPGEPVADSDPPAELDYEMWLGPAPYRPYNKKRVHYNFRFFSLGKHADGTTLTMRDDGQDGDAAANDGIYTVQISANLAVGGLQDADVFRKHLGFVDVYEGATRTFHGFVQSQVWTPAIGEVAKNNEAKVVVHTMTFLDRNLRNDSSVRAANAAFCAADQGKFREYMSATFAAQPAQEGVGWTEAQLATIAQSVSITGSALDTWKTCQQGLTYAAHIAALEINSERSGVNGTPTALLNGKKMNLSGLDAAGFRAAVKAGTA